MPHYSEEKKIKPSGINPEQIHINYSKLLLNGSIILFLLYAGSVLLIPLFFGLFISFIVYPINKKIENKIGTRGISTIISVLIFLIPVGFLCWLMINQVMNIRDQWQMITEQFDRAVMKAGIPEEYKKQILEKFNFKSIFPFIMPGIFSSLMASTVALVQIIMVPIYAGLILYYRKKLVKSLSFFLKEQDEGKIVSILRETITTYYNFVKGILFVYLIVGILNSLGLLAIGIPHPFIFGFVASVLTFIPYVGIIIGSILPITLAWMEFENIIYPFAVIGLFSFVQFLEAYLIFPFVVSSEIKINTLVTIVVIFLGGIIWGAAGMILFIPFAAILKLIAARKEELTPIANLLGNAED